MFKHRTFLLLTILLLILTTSIAAQDNESSPSSDINPDTIKENIKKRIEQVVKDQKNEQFEKKFAFLGSIGSITPNSLTLETTDGLIKQASTSADTKYIDTDTNKEVKREDASIGDFVAALGFLNQEMDVLDTKRVLILRQPPESPIKTSFYGSISSIDTKKNILELTQPKSGQIRLFTLSTKTTISTPDPNGLTNKKIEFTDITLGQYALIIFKPAAASTSASLAEDILIKSVDTINEPKPEE